MSEVGHINCVLSSKKSWRLSSADMHCWFFCFLGFVNISSIHWWFVLDFFFLGQCWWTTTRRRKRSLNYPRQSHSKQTFTFYTCALHFTSTSVMSQEPCETVEQPSRLTQTIRRCWNFTADSTVKNREMMWTPRNENWKWCEPQETKIGNDLDGKVEFVLYHVYTSGHVNAYLSFSIDFVACLKRILVTEFS